MEVWSVLRIKSIKTRDIWLDWKISRFWFSMNRNIFLFIIRYGILKCGLNRSPIIGQRCMVSEKNEYSQNHHVLIQLCSITLPSFFHWTFNSSLFSIWPFRREKDLLLWIRHAGLWMKFWENYGIKTVSFLTSPLYSSRSAVTSIMWSKVLEMLWFRAGTCANAKWIGSPWLKLQKYVRALFSFLLGLYELKPTWGKSIVVTLLLYC